LLAKDPSSGRSGCPSVFVDDASGAVVVWSNRLSWRTRLRVPHRLRGERGVTFRNMDVLAEAVDQWRAEQNS
jgi:hypothetical protein